MPNLPQKPVPGAIIPKGWFPSFWDFVRSLTPRGDNRTIAVQHTSDGAVFSILPGALHREAGGTGGGGAEIAIAKITARTAAKTYTVDIYSRYESDGTLNTTYRTATGDTMFTPGLNDTATADRLATGTILPVTKADVAGTQYWIPTYPVGLL